MPPRAKRGATGPGTLQRPGPAADGPESAQDSVPPGAGVVRAAVHAAIVAGHEAEGVDPRLQGLEGLAEHLAGSIDRYHDQPFAVAQLAPRLLDVLRELRLTPAPVQAADALTELLASLNEPT